MIWDPHGYDQPAGPAAGRLIITLRKKKTYLTNKKNVFFPSKHFSKLT